MFWFLYTETVTLDESVCWVFLPSLGKCPDVHFSVVSLPENVWGKKKAKKKNPVIQLMKKIRWLVKQRLSSWGHFCSLSPFFNCMLLGID